MLLNQPVWQQSESIRNGHNLDKPEPKRFSAEITNSKSQIANKSQYSKYKVPSVESTMKCRMVGRGCVPADLQPPGRSGGDATPPYHLKIRRYRVDSTLVQLNDRTRSAQCGMRLEMKRFKRRASVQIFARKPFSSLRKESKIFLASKSIKFTGNGLYK